MKGTITKETYLKIYQLLDTVSPVDYDCGELCESICCTCNDENTKDKDMVIYLLPGEEELFFDTHNKNDNNWCDISKENTKYYEYPKSWNGDVFFIRCKTPPTCNRKLRPIQCRTFPLTPFINEDNKLQMIYEIDNSTYICPLIKENIKLNQDFIEKTYKAWSLLIEDELIYDLIKMDSELIKKEERKYKIIR